MSKAVAQRCRSDSRTEQQNFSHIETRAWNRLDSINSKRPHNYDPKGKFSTWWIPGLGQRQRTSVILGLLLSQNPTPCFGKGLGAILPACSSLLYKYMRVKKPKKAGSRDSSSRSRKARECFAWRIVTITVPGWRTLRTSTDVMERGGRKRGIGNFSAYFPSKTLQGGSQKPLHNMLADVNLVTTHLWDLNTWSGRQQAWAVRLWMRSEMLY